MRTSRFDPTWAFVAGSCDGCARKVQVNGLVRLAAENSGQPWCVPGVYRACTGHRASKHIAGRQPTSLCYEAFRRQAMRTRKMVAINRSGSVSRPWPALHSEHSTSKFSSSNRSASESPIAFPSWTEMQCATSSGRSLRRHLRQVLLSRSRMRLRWLGLICGRLRSERRGRPVSVRGAFQSGRGHRGGGQGGQAGLSRSTRPRCPARAQLADLGKSDAWEAFSPATRTCSPSL
jgi:hypothetical protein